VVFRGEVELLFIHQSKLSEEGKVLGLVSHSPVNSL
jgi:hypothetical protein